MLLANDHEPLSNLYSLKLSLEPTRTIEVPSFFISTVTPPPVMFVVICVAVDHEVLVLLNTSVKPVSLVKTIELPSLVIEKL